MTGVDPAVIQREKDALKHAFNDRPIKHAFTYRSVSHDTDVLHAAAWLKHLQRSIRNLSDTSLPLTVDR